MSDHKALRDALDEAATHPHKDGERCVTTAYTADLAALLSERDALAAVAEAARAACEPTTDKTVMIVNAMALRDALAAYDRTVAKP